MKYSMLYAKDQSKGFRTACKYFVITSHARARDDENSVATVFTGTEEIELMLFLLIQNLNFQPSLTAHIAAALAKSHQLILHNFQQTCPSLLPSSLLQGSLS